MAAALSKRPVDAVVLDGMNQYLVHYYRRKKAVHSFVNEEGQVWDCIPVHQQLNTRWSKDRRFEQPPAFQATIAKETTRYPTAFPPGQQDAYGNVMACPEGCIPVRRITLEELAQYADLRSALKKSVLRDSRGRLVAEPLDDTGAGDDHKYALGQVVVDNSGADAFFNIWQPAVSADQYFSLAQIWMRGQNGNIIQTVEAGWTVFPSHFATNKPVLFIYWTADGYNVTGSYNKEDNSPFYQTNNNVYLGGPFTGVSQPGGPQIDVEFAWQFHNNAWWLLINGQTVGYYPAEIFGAGDLSRQSSLIRVGGEVNGQSSYPPMGSGAFPDGGFQQSAYIRNINYSAPGGGLQPAPLNYVATAPNCYRTATDTYAAWGSHFFFGGPGGNHC